MKFQSKHTKIAETLEDLSAILLENRGLSTFDQLSQTLHPTNLGPKKVGIDQTQLQKALETINQAIEEKKKIVIVGDYDADGVCATAIMWLTLKALEADVKPFIPDREKHGYGLSEEIVTELQSNEQPDLLITVDNGIVAHSAVEAARAAGITVIVTDHHQTDDVTSSADVVVHTTELCGSSVAWMLCFSLAQSKPKITELVVDLLDLVGIATIADQVPLLGANRSFVIAGLKALRNSKRLGIQELCRISAIDQKQITETTVGYTLAPRINAAGRLGDATEALRLLCTNSPVLAKEKAFLLNDLNLQRQSITAELCELADKQAEDQKNEQVLVIDLPAGSDGIIGLVAGKLTQEFNKPTIVMSDHGTSKKGSARSVPGIHITEFMRTAKAFLSSVGGHQLAGGFSVEKDQWEKVKEIWHAQGQAINPALLIPTVEVECAISENLLTIATFEHLQQFSPFGSGNPEPSFFISPLHVSQWQTLGSQKQHLKLLLHASNGEMYDGMWWQSAHKQSQLNRGANKVIARLGINEWNNRKKLQLIIKDIQAN